MPTLDQFREFVAAQDRLAELSAWRPADAPRVQPSDIDRAERDLTALARSLPVAELLAERERMAEAMRETADELRKWVRLSGLQWPAKLAAKLESALNEQGEKESSHD